MRIRFMHMLATIALLAFLTGCSGGNPEPFSLPPTADFSSLSWTDAFTAAHQKFSTEYAFTQWKGIDWNALYNQFLPRVQAAQASANPNAYYQALHDYLHSIADGHLMFGSVSTAVPIALMHQQIGGSYGLSLVKLDDGTVIAAVVTPGGPAALAGMMAGAQILQWNGADILTALNAVSPNSTVLFKPGTTAGGCTTPTATTESYRLQQAALLTRAAVGATVSVVFKNPGGAGLTVTLTAADDAMSGLTRFTFTPELTQAQIDDVVQYRVLPEGYGYILVATEEDPGELVEKFRQAMTSLVAANVPGIIIDLRGNVGGADSASAALCGFFYSQPSFYERTAFYDTRNGQFTIVTYDELNETWTDALWIKPQAPYFAGPVAVLVNPATISSGEGPAMHLKRLGKQVVGFHGTNGSFGMTGGKIFLPEGHQIRYPYGRSLDQNGQVQIDSRSGVGGIAPSLRVPKTYANVMAYASGTDVELQAAVQYLQSH